MREVLVALIASGLISVGGAAVTLYITSSVQAKTVADAVASINDHELRVRAVETKVEGIRADVEWIKNFLQRRFP